MARRFAYLIACDRYRDQTLVNLKTPTADVGTLAETLRNPNIGGFDEVEVLKNPSAAEVRQAIADLFHFRKRYDLLLFYFSGLALVDSSGDLFLASSDTATGSPVETALAADYINGWMNRSFSRRQILALDCYFAAVVSLGDQVLPGDEAAVGSALRGKGYWRAVLSASNNIHYVLADDSVLGHPEESLFTYAFVEGLRGGTADLDHDGQIGIRELFTYVNTRLVALGSEHRPQRWDFGEREDFIIARATGGQFRGRKVKWDLIFGAIAAPLVTVLLGWEADPMFAVEAAVLLLSLYVVLYHFAD